MRRIQKLSRRALYILLLGAMLLLPSFAAETYTTSDAGIDMLIGFEGFSETRYWDYSQYTIGYGTRYETVVKLFPELEDGETKPDDVVITREQGRAALQQELAGFENTVNRFLQNNGVTVNQHQFDALVSLTYNIGAVWTYKKNEDGTWYQIKQILLDGPDTWTEERVQDAFGRINQAGGKVLDGLVKRRAQEAAWFLTPMSEPAPQAEAPQEPEELEEPEEPEIPEAPQEPAAPETPEEPRLEEPVEAETVFVDVAADKWYYGYVMAAYRKGLMKGDGLGSFMPEDNLTRAEMLQVLANFSGEDLRVYTWGTYADVPAGRWYSPAVAWAAGRELIAADSGGNLNPDAYIDREEMCILLARFLSRYQAAPVRETIVFRDEDRMSGAGREAVRYCAARGLVDGVGDGLFDPSGSVSRGQIAKILLNMSALLEAA